MSKQGYAGPLEQIDECCRRISIDYKSGIRVEGRVFTDERLIGQICTDPATGGVVSPGGVGYDINCGLAC